MRDPRFAGNIGLAVCIEVGLKEHPNGYDALKTSAAFDRTFYPQDEFRERYDRLYPIYKSAFYALSKIYNKLNEEKGE
jgi:sugar (pentulose or hexulose) kinase